MSNGNETAKALSVNRRWVRGVLESPVDLERSRLSVHGLHSSHKYNGAVPRETRYIKTQFELNAALDRQPMQFSK